MERETIELDISRALAQLDQLRGALESTVTGPYVLGVTVDQGDLAALDRRLAAEDFEVEAEIVGDADQLVNDLDRAAAAAATVEDEAEDIARRLEDAGDETRESSEAMREMARALGVSEDEARQLSQEMARNVVDAERTEAAMEDVARELGLSETQARQFARQMDRAGDEAQEAEQETSRLHDNLKKAAAAAVAFVGIREGFRFVSEAVTELAEFDSAINQSLAIVSNVTPQLRTQFQEVARTVALETTFAANEAGEAFFFLASAGLTAEQQLAALPQVAQFAQAGMFDLALATDLLTDSQSALGLTVDDARQNLENMTRISDVLVQANILANASVQQFAEALTNRAGAALRIVNKDVEEGVAVLAAFADQGLKGEAAGEALNIVLRDLQRAALTEQEAFKEFGVAVFDSTGDLRNMADIVADLEVLIDGMSDAQVRATLTALGFQDRSVSNLLTLIGTSDAIREYETNLRRAGGVTEDVADKQLLGLTERFELVKSQADDAKISLGEALLPAVEAFIEVLPDMIGQFEQLGPQINSAAVQMADLATNIASVIGLLSNLGRGFGVVGDVVSFNIQNLGEFTNVIDRVVKGDIVGAWDEVGDAIANAGELVGDLSVRTIEQSLVSDLSAGGDAATALANSLAALSRSGELSEESLRRFTAISGLTTDEVARLNTFLRVQQDEHRFTAAEIDLLRAQFLNLTGTVLNARQGLNFGRQGRGALLDDMIPTEPQLTAVDAFQQQADELGISLGELVQQAAEQGEDLYAGLTPTDADALRFEVFSQAISEARRKLDEDMPSIVDNLELMVTTTNAAGEEVAATAEQILDDLIRQFETQAEFEANLARLAAAGADTLSTELRGKGPEAASAAEAFVGDIDRALEAEDILEGTATDNVSAFATTLGDELADQDFSLEAEQVMLGLALQLNTPAIRRAIADNVRSAARVIQTTFDAELEIDSPSRVTQRIGAQTAEGFLVGFGELSDPVLNFSPTFRVDAPATVPLDAPDLLIDAAALTPEFQIDPAFEVVQPDDTAPVDVPLLDVDAAALTPEFQIDPTFEIVQPDGSAPVDAPELDVDNEELIPAFQIDPDFEIVEPDEVLVDVPEILIDAAALTPAFQIDPAFEIVPLDEVRVDAPSVTFETDTAAVPSIILEAPELLIDAAALTPVLDVEPEFDIDTPDALAIDTPQLIYDAEPELTVSPRFVTDQADASNLIDTAATVPIAQRAAAATLDRAAITDLVNALQSTTTPGGGLSLQLVNVNPRVESAEVTTAKQLQIAGATVPLLSRTQPRLPRR